MADVLDHGYVNLVDSMGSDLNIVNAARTSYDSMSHLHVRDCPETDAKTEWEKTRDCFAAGCHRLNGKHLSKKDAGLINFLAKHRHGTPFEMVEFMFEVQAPIFVFREWHRHRIASINEMSGRYVELPRLFYVPAREDIRVQKGKPGAYFYEMMDDDVAAEKVAEAIRFLSNTSFDEYEGMLADGVAKEIARLVLPVNTYSKMVWKTNLRSLMNFLSLRNDERAQREIMYYAAAIEEMAFEVAPVAMAAFVDNGRQAP